PRLQLRRLLLEPERDATGGGENRQADDPYRRDRTQRDLRRPQGPGGGCARDRPQYAADARVRGTPDLSLRLEPRDSSNPLELEDHTFPERARQLERRGGAQPDGPHFQGRRQRDGARPGG